MLYPIRTFPRNGKCVFYMVCGNILYILLCYVVTGRNIVGFPQTLVSLGFAVVASRFIGLYEQSNRHQLITVIQELDFEDE